VQWPVFRVAVIEPSMIPAVYPGDWLLVLRARHPARIRPGRLVIAINPEKPDMLLVKRAARRADDGDGWWLTSDNPYAGAVDSSRFGPVPDGLIVGRVLARYWPFRHSSP
jgi:nickel-type superoxide dismutase maturation protease